MKMDDAVLPVATHYDDDLLFERDSARTEAVLQAIGHGAAHRVLDVGCGAGQELLPFLTRQSPAAQRPSIAVGIDSAPTVGRVGRHLFARHQVTEHVAFVRAMAEQLPFGSAVFDVVICRLVLPYTLNGKALAEMARTVKRGGLVLLQIHHARFYLLEMKNALRSANVRSAVHSLRVLTAGVIYIVTGRQPTNRFIGREEFQTESLLRRELTSCGMVIRASMPNTNPHTPSFVLEKV
jgi:ubiquinone/menaquinone biosynthesis C-methylase UbiE